MYDASGVRRQAGKHATVLNQLVFEFKKLVSEVKAMPEKKEEEVRKELKELLGHEPSEVFFGGFTRNLSYVSHSFSFPSLRTLTNKSCFCASVLNLQLFSQK